jgi:hypothetical protein
MRPGIIEIDLVAAQNFHLGAGPSRELRVGSAHRPLCILPLAEAGAQEHSEGRFLKAGQMVRQRGEAGVGSRLAVDEELHRQEGARLQPRDGDPLIIEVMCSLAGTPMLPQAGQLVLAEGGDQADAARVKGFVEGADPHRCRAGRCFMRDDHICHILPLAYEH